MNIFGVGTLEIIFILIIALIFIGPEDIGKYARSAGRFLNRFYRSDTWRLFRETSRNIRSLPNRLAREAALEELEEIKRTIEDTAEELNEVQDELDETEKELTESSKPAGKKESPSLQESQGLEDGLKAWTPQEKETKSNDTTAPAKDAQNAEGDQ
ncbi:MAG: hypothetical protein P8Z42_03910 [Anaerolineales bacterium]|jgi:sec-independent protein translocase protein TatA